MRVAVLFFGGGKRERTAEIARGLATGIEKAGHQVDVIDGDRDVNAKLTMYEYIAVGTSLVSLFRGRIDGRISEYLGSSGIIGGKKSFAFVVSAPFGSQRGLRRLMSAMEAEGLFIRYSDILRSREEAEVLASRLKLQP